MKTSLKILHLENLPGDALLIGNVIKKELPDCEILVVETKKKYIKAIEEFLPHIILADHAMPAFDSLEALEIKKALNLKIPFILLTAAMADEFAVDVLKKGADDYIFKDRLQRLPIAIINVLEKYKLADERQNYITELKNKEKRYRLLFENGADAVFILNKASKLSYVAPSIQRVLGYSEEEISQLGPMELLHPEDREKLAKRMVKCLAQPGVTIKGTQARIKHKDGNWRWMEGTITNMLHEPTINGIVDNFWDITERKLAELALLESEEKYRSFFENSQDAILLTVTDGEIFAANPAACHIFQMTENEIIKTSKLGLVDPLDARVPEAMKESMRLGQVQAEITLIRKDGTKFPGEISSLVFKDATGKSITSLIIRNITERKQAEEDLKSSEEQYKLLFQYSPLPQWIFDLDTFKILDVNETAITHYGYSRQEFLQLTILDIRAEEDRSKILPFIQKNKIRKGVVKFGVLNHLKKDRTPIKVDASAYRLSYKGSDCMMVTCLDITEKEIFLEKLKDTRDKLLIAQSIAHLGYWDYNIKDKEIYWTDEAYKIFERDRNTFLLTADTIKAAIHPEDEELVKNKFTTSFVAKAELDVEHRIITPNGTLKWIHVRGSIVKEDKQKPLFFRGTFQDITERKVASEQLMISEARHRGIVQSQTNYLFRTNLQGEYTFCNDKYSRDFSWLYPDNIILGKNPLSSTKEYHHQRIIDISKKCLDNPNRVFQVEIDKPLKNGGVRNTIWDFICFTNAQGHPSEIQCVGVDITEQIQARKKIQESEKKYRQIVETAQEGIWLLDENGLTTFVNRKMVDLFEYSEEEMLGKEIFPFIDEEGWQKAATGLKNLKAGKTDHADAKLVSKSGSVIWAKISANPIFDEDGIFKGSLAMVSDISEQKKLAELLKEATQLARIGSYEADLTADFHFWSPVMREIYEVDEDFIPNSEIKMVFFQKGDYRERMNLALQEAVLNNIPFDMELEIITAKGNKKWVRDIGKAEFKDGKCIRLYGSLQDIDKTKRAELAVLKAFEEKAIILESIGDAFIALDSNWIVSYWNKGAERLLNCPRSKVINKNMWHVFADVIDTPTYEHFYKAVAENSIQHFEAFYDTTKLWYEVSAYPSATGLTIYFKDVTERKLSNIKLHQLNESLQNYTKELVTSNKELEQFSYIVSHNLRAPVATITGLANILNQDNSPPEVKKKCLEGLHLNVQRLDNVIKDLNNILQVKKEIAEKKEVVNLAQLVYNIEASIEGLIQKEGVQIHIDFNAAPEFFTLKSYLHSIFYNLISNSIKYRHPDLSPIIQIKSEIVEDELIIIFKDNGLGIDLAKKKDQVFGLYKRFHLHIEGKGMGLFMVKTQVQTLGGEISISSEINNGTEFKIKFKTN